MAEWRIDESLALSMEEAWTEATTPSIGFEETAARAPLAVVLRDATVHETLKLFGGADIRLDALFVTAPSNDLIYHPGTFPFSGIRDHDDLPIGEGGLLLYLGRPRYFLDISIVASRNVPNGKTLTELLAEASEDVGGLLGGVTALTSAAPHAAAITMAAASAAKLGGVVLRLLTQTVGRSIGLYRTTWFEHRDTFGLGRHPSDGDRFRVQDLEFCYEIFEDEAGAT